jgi:elongation factor G
VTVASIRNIGVVAHIDAGKTTVSERILFYTGVERRMGEVHEGTATLDWMEEERKRGITITSAATTVPWRDFTLNLIDTPGHVDFTVEVERCMRVLDGAILVLNGVAGVQAQTETVWRQMERHHVPYVAFVNQLDRPGADALRAIASLRDRLGVRTVPVQYPVGTGAEFRVVVDLLRNRALEYDVEDLGREPHEVPMPEDVREEVGVLRAELLEVLSEEDDVVLAALLEDREPSLAELNAAMRRRVIDRTLVPVLVGAALRNVGVQPLLDAVVDWLPSPLDVPPIRGQDLESGAAVEFPPDPDGPRCVFVFKLAADPHEDLAFARIYSGTIRPGDKLFHPRKKRMERIARVLHMHADARNPVERAGPGDIVALTGLKMSATGDTLGEHDPPVVLERLEFPDPVITRVVEPDSTADRDRLRTALEHLAFEDPSFHVQEDESTGQWLIAGMGELHLEIKEHRLSQDFHLAVHVGNPRVAYREATTRAGAGAATVDRVLAGTRNHGAVELEVRPAGEAGATVSAGAAPQVVWEDDGAVPEAFRGLVTEALEQGAQVGPRFGYPLVDTELAVTGGASHPECDSELGFSQAVAQALRQALQAAEVSLLEPAMAFEITAPAEFMSGILAELNSKRAEIADLEVEEGVRTVTGSVPLFTMFGYSSTLRSLSQGRASFSLTPAGFVPVPEQELEPRGLVWH